MLFTIYIILQYIILHNLLYIKCYIFCIMIYLHIEII